MNIERYLELNMIKKVLIIILASFLSSFSLADIKQSFLLISLLPRYSSLIANNLILGNVKDYQLSFQRAPEISQRQGYGFSNLVILGDSMSDQGSGGKRSSLYIAGGQRNPLYTDYLSRAMSGKPSLPVKVGGKNYAITGATLTPIEKYRSSATLQYTQLLTDEHGQLDHKALYILWIGNMDIYLQRLNQLSRVFLGQYNIEAPQFTLTNTPYATANLAEMMVNTGARYIIVPNLPYLDLMPLNLLFLNPATVSIASGLSVLGPLILKNTSQRLDQYLRNPANLISTGDDHFVRTNQIRALHHQLYWFLPYEWPASIYNYISDVEEKLVSQYNRSLAISLAKIPGNHIIYFDYAALIKELANHPEKYGLDNSLVPTCDLSYSSRWCDADSPHFHKGHYLFSDGAHPSAQLHLIIAQSMISIVNAPVYVSSIARQADTINDTIRTSLSNNQRTSMNSSSLAHPSLLLTYAGAFSHSAVPVAQRHTFTSFLNIGTYYQLGAHWMIGSVVSLGFGHFKPHTQFTYQFNHQNLSAFLHYRFAEANFLDLYASIGRLKTSDIKRYVPIYTTWLSYKGATQAYSRSIMAQVSFSTGKNTAYRTGPLFRIGWDNFKVNGYSEKGPNFLAMTYDNFHYRKKYVELGWYYHTSQQNILNKSVVANIEVAVNRRLGKNKFSIPSKLQSSPVVFNREIQDSAQSEFKIDLRATTVLSHHSHLSLMTGYHTDLKGKNSFPLALNWTRAL